MKIAITATGPTLEDQVEARFGRCPYFLVVDTETMAFEAVENPNVALGGGAGIQSAQLMAQHEVQVVLTGNCGPNAFRVMGEAGIQVIVGASGPIREAVEQFKSGAFSASPEPNVASHFGVGTGDPLGQQVPPTGGGGFGMGGGGMGRGMGGGGGRGMGRGMGGGRGMGRGMGLGGGMGAGMTGVPPAAPYSAPPGTPQQPGAQIGPEQELEMLRAQAQSMNDQIRAINARITELGQRGKGSALVAVVDSEKCTGCGTCEEVCPIGAIAVDDIAQVDPEKCDGCGQCVPECPQDALSLRKA